MANNKKELIINSEVNNNNEMAMRANLASIAANSKFISGVFSVGKDSLLDGDNNINLIGKVSPAFNATWKILLKNLAVSLKHVIVDSNISDDKIFVKDLDIKANIVAQNNKIGWLNHTVTCGDLTNLLLKETRFGIDTLMVKMFSDDHRFIIGKTDDMISSFWTEFDEQIILLSKQTAVSKIKEISSRKANLGKQTDLSNSIDNLINLNEKAKANSVEFTYLKGSLLFELMLADSNVMKVFKNLCTTSNEVLANKLTSVFSILSSLYDILVDSRERAVNKDNIFPYLDRSNAHSAIAIKVT